MREAEIPNSDGAAATISYLRLTVDDLHRLADLDPANAEAIRHIADQCDRQITDLSKRLGIASSGVIRRGRLTPIEG